MAETLVNQERARAPEAAARAAEPPSARALHPALDAHQRSYSPKACLEAGAALRIDASDVQGIVLRGYGALPFCSYVLLQVHDPQQGRAFLRQLAPRVAPGAPAAEGSAVQVAFTHAGLAALGLPDATLQGFSREFIAGMWGEHKSRFLGDVGDSAPDTWLWGGPSNPAVHVLLLLYADREERLQALHDELVRNAQHCDLVAVRTLETTELSRHEHFGFVDGISQPAIEGYHPGSSRLHTIKAGEFLLGHPNEYGQYTERPLVEDWRDPVALLPLDVEGSPRRDLGRNGTYLVFRQLRQNVVAFRDALDALSQRADGTPDPHARELLAAQLVGRWPSGTSLIEAPYRDDASKAEHNEFDYHHSDPEGLRCPIGAHVRRANPRDALAPHPGSEGSLAVNRRHRLIRRGRSYGPVLAEGARDTLDRGLMFIALNANISRQFEFVQHSWLIDPRFNGLYDQADPLVGAEVQNQFVVPGDPVRRRCTGLTRFVEVAGGGYFFLPGIRALHFLAESLP